MFVVTMDTDWVPQFVLDHLLGLLSEAKVKATIFCTGVYDGIDAGGHEVGLHPNLMSDSTQGDGEEDILSSLKSAMPEAVGVRTHRHYWHGGLLPLYKRHGIAYDSSLLMPLQPALRPYTLMDIVRVPVWWSDGFHFDRGLPMERFDPPGLDQPGLKVLLFHPIHVYLNSEVAGYANKVLGEIGGMGKATPEALAPYRRKGTGMETVCRSALEFLAKSDVEVQLLKECAHSV